MTCSNCGKDVPFGGNVCPYCKADKSGDQMIQAIAFMGAMAGGVAGGIVGLIVGNILAGVATGMIIGMIAGAFVAADVASKAKARKAAQARAVLEEQARQRVPIAANAVQVTRSDADIAAYSQNQERALIASGVYRECPHCAEVIKAAAKVCRFCQRDIEPER
jgi:predicted lipid-binding transport protein (Tim44 family)